MNPMQVASNRTARLAATEQRPTYTTSSTTPKRMHVQMIEVEDMGGRYWSGPYSEKAVPAVCDDYEEMGFSISDIDCSAKCWCAKENN